MAKPQIGFLLKAMRHLAVLLAMLVPLSAQMPQKSFVGTVSGFRPETAEIELRPDSGELFVGKVSVDTIAQQIAPGERDLKKATAIKITDLAKGDRVLVTPEPGTSNIRRIVAMSVTDIARRNETERLDWQKRGAAGIVSARSANTITVKTRTPSGAGEVTISVSPGTTFKRYAPDSVKFSEAKPSKIAEINIGDQLRARGEKNADGLNLAAEEVVFGTFLVKAGAITAVNAETKEFTIKELGTEKALTVKLTADSQVKQMPDMPPMMAGAGPRMPAGGPSGVVPMGPPAGGRGGLPGGGFDINQMLERMPAATVEDLKPGATVVISSTKGARSDQLTAILVLSNAGMLIQMASAMNGGNRGGGAGAMNGPGMGGMMGGDMLGGLGLGGIIP
jgi:hypothetical protein